MIETGLSVSGNTVRRCALTAQSLGWSVAVVGSAVLAGWLFDLETLKSGFYGAVAIKPNTAIGLLLCGLAVVLGATDGPPNLAKASRLLAGLAGTIGLLTLIQYLFGADLGIDQLVIADRSTKVYPGRMAPATALALVSMAVAMVVRDRGDRRLLAFQGFLMVPFALGALGLVGYILDFHFLYGWGTNVASMACPTAAAIIALSSGAALTFPREGLAGMVASSRMGGAFARRALPVALLVPVAVAWARIKGEQLGWYDTQFGIMIMVLSAIVVFSVLILVNARRLNLHDQHLRASNALLETRVVERTADLETAISRMRTEIVLRETADAARQISEARFRNALEFAPIGIAIVGLDGRWIEINRALCEIVGYDEQTLLGLTFQDITHPDDLDADLAHARKLVDGEISSYQTEKRYLRKDGGMVWVMLSVSLVQDAEHKPIYFVAQIEDISARRKAMQDLDAGQKLLSEVIAALPVPFALKTDDSRWLMVNDAMARYSGKPVEDLIGRTDAENFGPALAAIYQAEDIRALASSEAIGIEGINVTASGEERWALKHKRGIKLPDGRRLVAVAVTDISEHRKTGERLRQSEERFRALTELSADWYWEQDENFRFTLQSGGILPAIGIAADAYLGKTRWEMPYDNMTVEAWATHRSVLEAHRPYHDLVLTRELDDGTRRYITVSGQPMFGEHGSFRGYRGSGRDVTAQKRAENELADSRQFLSEVIDAIPIPLTVKDDQRRLIIVNRANEHFHGRPSQEVTGKFDTDLYPPELAKQFQAEDDAVLESGEPMIEEQAFTTMSGELRWVIKQKRRIAFSDGRRWLIVTLLDITNRKHVESALAEREAWLHLVTENSAACIGYIDTEQRFRFCNGTYQKWYGVPAAAMLGKSIMDVIGAKDYPQVESAYRQALLGRRSNYERTIAREGTNRTIFVDLIPDIREGGIIAGVFTYSVDITSRVESEKALHESEERFQIVVQGTEDGIWDWNLDTGRCYFSPRYKKMLGYEDSEFPDVRASFEARLHADDRIPTFAALKSHFERHEPYEVEYRLRDKGGEYRWFQARGQATWGEDGKPVRFSGALGDITQRKQSELDLAESRRFLADLIDAIPIPITVKDASHRFVIVNAAMGRFLGCPAADMQNKFDADFFSPERVVTMLAEDDVVLETGAPFVNEESYVTISGESRWVLKHKRRVVSYDGKHWVISALLDITQRKQVELEVERSQKFLKSVIDAIPQPLFVKDSRHRWVLFNAAFCELVGREHAELLGRSDSDFFPQAWVKRVWAEDDQVINGSGSLVTGEDNLLSAGGGARWLLKSKRRVTLSDGSAYIVGISTDITHLKQVEEALRKSDEQHRLLADNSSDLISLLTPAGAIEYASPACVPMLGVSPEHLLGRIVTELIHPDDATRALQIFGNVVRKQESVVFSCRLLKADGTSNWIETSFKAIRDPESGRTLRVIAVSRDISDRVLVTDALNRFKYVLDSALDTILLYDVETLRFTYVNDGAVKTLGYAKEKLLGMSAWELRADISAADYHKSIEPFLRGDIQSRQFEAVYRHADGALIPMDVSMQLVRVAGEPATFIAVARDATGRKKVERLKNEFVSTVSHELRTPLTSIRGSLGLLAGGVAGNLPEQARQLIDIARNNSERLIRLINDILDIEKIESGKMRFAMRPIALRDLLETILAENRGYAEQYGVRLIVLGDIPDIVVRVDPDGITQVMANLLSNAAKFSPRDGDVEILVVVASAGLHISVTDHGSGVPLEFQSRIFGKFSQADASDSRKMSGTGLGLSIAKAIVEKHGGTIGFASTPAGTAFFFDLPPVLCGQHGEGAATGSVAEPVVI